MTEQNPVLSVHNLQVMFTQRGKKVVAVDDLSFNLHAGETLGIVGESGSGKSVSCLALLQLLPQGPDVHVSGEALYQGNDLLGMNKKEIRAIRTNEISMIFQDPMTSLNPFMRIGTQIIEPLHRQTGTGKSEAKQRALDLLLETGIAIDLAEAQIRYRQYPHELSGGMRQRVMIAMALISNPTLLIADEPTTALDTFTQAQILSLIKHIQTKRNLAVIFVSHDLDVIRKIADRTIVMQHGKLIETGQTEILFSRPMERYTRELLSAIPNKAKPSHLKNNLDSASDLLTVTELGVDFRVNGAAYSAVQQVSFSVRYGEVFGLVGESGSGKSTVSNAINRLCHLSRGGASFEDRLIHQLNPAQLKRLRKHMQVVFQDPYASLDPRMSAYEIIAQPLRLHRLVHNVEGERRRVFDLAEQVELTPDLLHKYPHAFSGGQRQRIAIARALAVEPKLIIADEPVSALDVTVQSQIMQLLLELVRQQDMAMIFISHDLRVVRYMTDRMAVMQDGNIVEMGETEQVFNAPTHPYTRSLLSAAL